LFGTAVPAWANEGLSAARRRAAFDTKDLRVFVVLCTLSPERFG
jgi:hypothetical protein